MGPSKKGAIVVALYNYQGSEHGDMTFVKGDVMEIVDDTDPDWWLAKNINSGATGHIPRNYVAFQSSLELPRTLLRHPSALPSSPELSEALQSSSQIAPS